MTITCGKAVWCPLSFGRAVGVCWPGGFCDSKSIPSVLVYYAHGIGDPGTQKINCISNEFTFTYDTLKKYILCELNIAAQNRALSYRYSDLCTELENVLGNFTLSLLSENFRDGPHFLHEIYIAVCTVDASQRHSRAHSVFQATLEYKLTVANGGKDDIDKWIWSPIIDTGATVSMTKNKNYLFNYHMLTAPIQIGTAGGHAILGIAKGDMKLANGRVIKGVLHVPELSQDLLSTGHLRDNLKSRYVDSRRRFLYPYYRWTGDWRDLP